MMLPLHCCAQCAVIWWKEINTLKKLNNIRIEAIELLNSKFVMYEQKI